MSNPRDISPIVGHVCRIVARIIQIFAVYVVFHGHYSPGGGFQGGALLAAAVIILRITQDPGVSQRELPSSWALPIGALGVFIFLGVGLVDLAFGGNFLQYEYTPLLGSDPARIHYWAILIVEVGIALAVMAILVAIFDQLMDRGDAPLSAGVGEEEISSDSQESPANPGEGASARQGHRSDHA